MKKSGQLEQQGIGERSGSQRKWLLKVRNVEKRDMNIREWNKEELYLDLLRFFSTVQFSRSVVSNSLRPHEPQYTRPPCPLPTPGVHPNPGPLCWWCHPTISSSVVPFSSCPQSFPASGSFQMSQLSASGGQRIGVSASTSVPPVNSQDKSPFSTVDVNWSSSICVHSNYFFIIHFIWFVVYFLGRYST